MADVTNAAKETGQQLANDASQKVEEVKETGAQLADEASKQAEEAKTTLVEKAQEITHAVKMNNN